MFYTDFTDWWTNKSGKDELEDQVIKRIGKYIEAAHEEPEQFRLPLLLSLLFRDRTAYAMVAKDNPSWLADMQKAVYGRKWDWGQDQVSQLLGYKDVSSMFERDEDGIPAWKKLSDKDKPEEISKELDDFFAVEEGIKPGMLYKWLEKAQKQYDAQREYTGWGADKNPLTGIRNVVQSLIAPRTYEAHVAGKEASGKDILGDALENVAYAVVPTGSGRFLASLGAKGLGTRAPRAYKFAYRPAEYMATNASAPIAIEEMDKELYNETDNPKRSRFSLTDVLGGTAVNMATAPAIAGGYSAIAEKVGMRGPSKGDITSVLSSDPYVEAAHIYGGRAGLAPSTSAKKPVSQLQLESEIYNKVFNNPKLRKELSKKQVEDWENWIKNEAPEEVQNELRAKLDAIKSIPNPDRRAQKLREFIANREQVTPTAMLGEDAYKYGLDLNNRLADVTEVPAGIGEGHNIAITTDDSRSAAALAEAEKTKTGRKDTKYPNRPSQFDVAVEALPNDPEVVSFSYLNKPKSSLKDLEKPLVISYGVNKAGKDTYGEALIGKLPQSSEIDEDVEKYLNDDAMKAMWDNGFVPRGKYDEPIMKAYRIYKQIKEEEDREEKASMPDVKPTKSSSTAGKKAGF